MAIIDTGEISLYYEEKGNGMPIVFLHGFTLDRRMWLRQVEYFSHNYRAIVYDSRGHGKSDCPESGYSRAHRVQDLKIFVEKLKINRFHIVGLSMGGATALGYAIDCPEKLCSLVLVDTAAGGYQPPQKYKDMRDAESKMSIDRIRRLWKKSALFSFANKDRGLRAELARMIDDHQGHFWSDPKKGTYIDRDDVELSVGIKIPTLICSGERDSFFVPLAKKLRQNIDNSVLEIFPGKGHMLNMEAPEEFNLCVGHFIDRVDEQYRLDSD